MNETQSELEEPPGRGRPPQPREDVPPTQWSDHCRQPTYPLNKVEEPAQVIHLTPPVPAPQVQTEEVAELSAPSLFRPNITTHFAGLANPDHPDCPHTVAGPSSQFPSRFFSRPKTANHVRPRYRGAAAKGWRVAFLYNLKHHALVGPDAPPDALAEYDSVETVQAIEEALLAGGHQVIPLEADETLLDTIRQAVPDICFNFAEGLRGDARESQVPALLEMLGIPYTGSGVLGHALSLDKGLAKRMWRDHGLPTAPFQVFQRGDEPLDPALAFPLFIKPAREGSGMGINGHSTVHDEVALREQVRWILQTYRQPALVEMFLPGREFTVGLIGNTPLPGKRRRNGLVRRDERGFRVFPVLEIDTWQGAGHGVYNVAAKSYYPGEAGAPAFFCPADIPVTLETDLKELAVAAFEAIGARDLARVDLRLGADGQPYLLEINTLPGLKPAYSDMCLVAEAAGMSYTDLINGILNLAAERYRLAVTYRSYARQRSRRAQERVNSGDLRRQESLYTFCNPPVRLSASAQTGGE
jgi:D-alanine-D-alanine ligase